LDISSASFLKLLSAADRAVARLDGAVSTLPNPDLFIFMYVRREAVLSSQIEGTQASMLEVLNFQAELFGAERNVSIEEVMNYIGALRHGMRRLSRLPVSLRLIREIHKRLMRGARGGEPGKEPGEFRRSQNWIGGSRPDNAIFVPPSPEEMKKALGDWEKYLHRKEELPDLIHIGLLHAQFETIHPFIDGNGRVGRLLISLLLAERKILGSPLLYLSLFFKRNRQEYYDRLQAVRDRGEWESWLEFFLTGVVEVASEATKTARSILALREIDREKLSTLGRRSGRAHQLLDYLFQQPIVSVKLVQDVLGLSQPASNSLVRAMASIGILKESTGFRRNRKFTYERYLRLFPERKETG
jgi:Fic family protein